MMRGDIIQESDFNYLSLHPMFQAATISDRRAYTSMQLSRRRTKNNNIRRDFNLKITWIMIHKYNQRTGPCSSGMTYELLATVSAGL